MSIRALARRHGVHRRTVRQALADASPPARKLAERSAPATGPYVDLVRRWLTEDLAAPRKQRHTARRIWQRLIEEEDARLGESTVRNLVARLRSEIGADRCQVMVPQTHPPAEEAEVDFGEFTASIAGQLMKLYMFCMRLSHSGKAFHFGYANQTQESFLDGHVRAFEAFGGVPTGMIRYDNLKPAVIRIALGRERFEHPRFVAMRSHYGFDSFFCAPGIEGAHEKGGVEGEIGRFRRRHLTPIPHVGSLEALNAALAAADARDDARRIAGRAETVGQAAAQELLLLRPLPGERFDVALRLSCRVDAKARICVRQSYYSVPARYASRRLEVRLGATMITVHDGATIIAEHPRSLRKYSEDLVLDHYLEVLCRKPGAFAGSTPLAAARALGMFTVDHQRFWENARHRLGDGGGTRALIGVLLLHRTMPAEAVIASAPGARARFPGRKTLEEFDFDHARGLKRDLILHLGTLDFVTAKENVIFLGPPGTGKTHLATGLGIRACQAGHRVLFATASQWVDRLADAHNAGRLQTELIRLARYPLLVVDEVGYIPFEAEAANLFFQLVASRYEHASLIVTSNQQFGRRGEVFGGDVVAAAMIDRLVQHADVVALKGDSYRLKNRDLGRVPTVDPH